ncbi:MULTISPECIES: type IV secretory system conjugative DNA transfer family protein [Snodgrassella]|uniref:type IV secretory system conjugative DNA transfer family protein n=1 Tax=Snodgrassella TaxID=1193515 RepID=UPI000815D572|nr:MULTISPECIES: type IV secretory system conjugative DNA transfer family protein [Snodgrassella]MCO6521234.1 type IV secretory system conjugative DNA transfer family protein [Snodgrassella sp.]SCC04484.1 type IV secretion system protein VirD4 [Snodgrassella sp. R-53583]
MANKKDNSSKVWILASLAILAMMVLIVAGLWIASALFLATHGVSYTKATPLMIVKYWHKYGEVAAMNKSLKLCTIAGALVVILPPVGLFLLTNKKQSLHGDAAFAKTPEIKKAGLFDVEKNAILVGKRQNRLLYYGGNEFAALAAPTRTGKGVGVIIPNCLNYNDSMIVLDVKGENFKITSGYRTRVLKQKVFKFSPFTSNTHRWNPLSYISKKPAERISDVIQLSYMFYPDKKEGDNFFPAMARDLFVACVLYLMDTPTLPLTIGYVRRMASGFGKPLKDYVEEIINKRDKSLPFLCSDCVEKFSQVVNQSDNTLSGIIGSFTEPLGLWTSAYVDMATSDDDFDFRDLRKQRMTVYFHLPANRIDEARVLINLFYSQALSKNLDTLPEDDKSLKYQLLLMMDEFTAAGAITEVKKSVSYIAGFNIRLLMIYQNRSQLEDAYGKNGMRTLLGNTRLTIIYTPVSDPISDSQEYSEMMGYKTIKGRSISRGGGREGQSVSISDQKRALMLPQELRAMPDEDEIILMRGINPIRAQKIIYWKDPIFTKRLLKSIRVPHLNVSEFMAAREGIVTHLTEKDISAGKFNPEMLVDIEEVYDMIDDSMTEEEIKAVVDSYFAAKTDLDLNVIANITS